jgi:glycine cleavage system T protein (aminomethyltransferase)
VPDQTPLKHTPLHALHLALGARMVPFAGYDMPVRYGAGIIDEHRHTRNAASLFDVSHMGQIRLLGDHAAAALETLVPADVIGLGEGRMRYTMFTNRAGGIVDDLMVTNVGDYLFLVVNAGCKHADLAHLTAALDARCRVEMLEARALLALQGPQAAAVLARLAPAVADMAFMSALGCIIDGSRLAVMRAGYTGEDGFELSVPAEDAERIARLLLGFDEVRAAGLGARDTLRLEAGLCLYGHDIDAATTPVEAGLQWTIPRRRRAAGGFPGDAVIRRQLEDGPPRRRIGIRLEGRAIAREGAAIHDAQGSAIGVVTSGGFGPSCQAAIAMGYVAAAEAEADHPIAVVVRGRARPARVVAMPFVAHRYHRK